ncbi:MAG: helix-turn-helix domain-containing protein [Coprobacillus sp.]|nr:helix-turn-helix domain-containing protein [Coprobacillus sp.]MDY4144702.1 helix-turn-helix domain-containing protein [Bacilli bacterium]CCY07427.1 putative transcriptional regulator PucR family [Coprobacillus sp. CAG:698]
MLFESKLSYNANQKQMIDFLNGNVKTFLLKDKSFFIITSIEDATQEENIINLYNNYLYNSTSIVYKNMIISFYQKKEKMYFQEIIDSLSEDLGTRIKIFEGFRISLKNNLDFLKMFSIIEKYREKDYSYMNITDVILSTNTMNINTIREILLCEELKDYNFITLVREMLKNDLNVSKAANDLYMHRNTLNNKLDTIEFNTSISLRNFKGALSLYELLKEYIKL